MAITYKELDKILSERNRAIEDTFSTKVNNFDFDSAKKQNLRLTEDLSATQFFTKQRLLGIVSAVEWDNGNVLDSKIYVSIPNYAADLQETSEANGKKLINNEGLKRKNARVAFYPVDKSVCSQQPKVGNSVWVQIPENFGGSAPVNPRDCLYLGIYNDQALIGGNYTTASLTEEEKRLAFTVGGKLQGLRERAPNQIAEDDYVSWPFAVSDATQLSSLPTYRFTTLKSFQPHTGLDIAMNEQIVKAPYDLRVIECIAQEGISASGGIYFKAIQVKNGQDGRFTYEFFHLKKLEQNILDSYKSRNSKTPKIIKKGEAVAISNNTGGSTGPHLHFGMFDNNTKKYVAPLYFIKGPSIKVQSGLQKEAGLPPIVNVPFIKDKEPITVPASENPPNQAPAPAPQAAPPAAQAPAATSGTPGSAPINRPKMLLIKFGADLAKGVINTSKLGSRQITIREDVFNDLEKIKKILNEFNISLSLLENEIKLDNNKLSFLGKVGLEVNLNYYAGLTETTNLEIADYLVGPDYSFPIGIGHKLKVYAPVKKIPAFIDESYEIKTEIIDVYDIRDTYLKTNPKIIKVKKTFFDLTKLFEKFGFVAVSPRQEFFVNSDYKKSNWFIYQKPLKISKGYTYKELLETVYYKNDNPIWNSPEIYWDGSKFI